MKKLLFTVALATAAFSANAQTDKGRLFLNGIFSASSKKTKGSVQTKMTELAFAPAAGYFLVERFAVGLGFNVARTRTKELVSFQTPWGLQQIREGEITKTSLYVTPFARYYVPVATEKFHFFAQAMFGIGSSSNKLRNSSNGMEELLLGNSKALDFSLSPGFAYFPSDHWAAELRFRGFYMNRSESFGGKITEVGLGLNSLTPSLGVSYFF